MLFAVTRRHVRAWRDGVPLEGQDGWVAHAGFMAALADARFVILGGPLEGTDKVLLIIRAETAEEVRTRLSRDPWSDARLLTVERVTAWTLRLDSLDRAGGAA